MLSELVDDRPRRAQDTVDLGQRGLQTASGRPHDHGHGRHRRRQRLIGIAGAVWVAVATEPATEVCGSEGRLQCLERDKPSGIRNVVEGVPGAERMQR